MTSMIAAIISIPRGACAQKPVRYELSTEEAEAVQAHYDGRQDGEEEKVEIAGLPRKLWYSEKEDDDIMMIGETAGEITEGDEEMMADEDDDPEEQEDVELRPTDAIFLCAKTEDEVSSVEMHVYDEESGSLYVHHDLTLPAFPLTLEWLRLDNAGSFVAVGTFENAIEIWNLDVLDALEPRLILGDNSKAETLGKKKSKKKLAKEKKKKKALGHVDAVMSLSWNRLSTGMLASGSADETVKIWDLNSGSVATSWKYPGKVQTIKWHPCEAPALAAGGDDRRLTLRDCRAAESLSIFTTLNAEIECLAWHPKQPTHIVCSCDDGLVTCFDVRSPPQPLWSMQPHSESVPAIAYNEHGLLATASNDKFVKLFDADCTMIAQKEFGVGKLFALTFDDGNPYLLAAAGSKATLALWNTVEIDAVSQFAHVNGSTTPQTTHSAPIVERSKEEV